MIVKDVIQQAGYDPNSEWRPYAQAWVRHCYNKHKEHDVVAFKKDLLGVTFIIRGARKFFCFSVLKPKLWFGGYDYRMTRFDNSPKNMQMVVHQIETDGTILQEDLFMKVKNKLIVDAI